MTVLLLCTFVSVFMRGCVFESVKRDFFHRIVMYSVMDTRQIRNVFGKDVTVVFG